MIELSPEREQARNAYRERIIQLMGQRAVDLAHIPNDPCDEGSEGKNG